MINKIIEYSATHRGLIITLVLSLVLIGVWSIRNVPLDAIPDLSDPQVIIYTEYEGGAQTLVALHTVLILFYLATAAAFVPFGQLIGRAFEGQTPLAAYSINLLGSVAGIVAFSGLVGKNGNITNAQMQQFSDFALQIFLPPNPVRALNNSLNTAQQNGSNKWFSCGAGTIECAQLDSNATDTVTF